MWLRHAEVGKGEEVVTTCPFRLLTASENKVPTGGGRSRCELQPFHSGEQVGLQSLKKLYQRAFAGTQFYEAHLDAASSLGVSNAI